MRNTELMAEVRKARPVAGWAESSEGRAVLRRVLDDEVASQRLGQATGTEKGTRLNRVRLAAAAAVIAIAAVGFVPQIIDGSGPRPMNGEVVFIEGSYAFEVTNLKVLMDHTSDVFVARVLSVEDTDDDLGMTYYRVAIEEVAVGSQATGEVMVRQIGYVDGSGTVHRLDDQPLLEVDDTYLLATSYDADRSAFTVSAGPISVRPLDSVEEQHRLIQEYRAAESR